MRACDLFQEPRWASRVRSTAVQARRAPHLGRGRVQGSTRWFPGTETRAGEVQGPTLPRFLLALQPSGDAPSFLSDALPQYYLSVQFLQEVVHPAWGSFQSCRRFPKGASRIPNFRRGLSPDQWHPGNVWSRQS